jgi:hypothetical protein
MTPQELETSIRQRLNAVNDTFWSQSEMFSLIEAACNEMAKKALVIERVYTTTTVAGQQEYSFPTNTISIKRVTYNGQKLTPITFREDDALTLSNSATLATGTPSYYAVWNSTLYLRAVPDDAQTLKIFSYNKPQTITVSSEIEVPEQFQNDLIWYCLSQMHAKEKNYQGAKYYQDMWDKALEEARRWSRLRKRGDSFVAVQDLETLPATVIGAI